MRKNDREINVSIHAGNLIFECRVKKEYKIHNRLCNVYTKVISQSNVCKSIKKFNEGRMELHNDMQLGRPLDLVNEKTCSVVCCLLDNDDHLTISDLHHAIAAQYTNANNVSQTSIYRV